VTLAVIVRSDQNSDLASGVDANRLFAYSITSSAVAMSVAGNRFDKKSR
jgi:hypothetical protein